MFWRRQLAQEARYCHLSLGYVVILYISREKKNDKRNITDTIHLLKIYLCDERMEQFKRRQKNYLKQGKYAM